MEDTMTMEFLIKRRIIGWLCNNENYTGIINGRCYVYPEYVQDEEGQWKYIPRTLFPQNGAIEVIMMNSDDSNELINKNGHLVDIRINELPQENNNENAQNRYILQYNSRYGSDSKIDIRAISNTTFYQVIKYDNVVDLEHIGMEIPNMSNPYTYSILLLCEEGLYGPFFANPTGDTLQLKASDKTQYRVGKFQKDEIYRKSIDITDNYGNDRVQLVPLDCINLNDAIETADWMDNDKLLSLLGKLFRNSEENNFTKSNINVIKQTLLDNENAEQLGLDLNRKKRIEKMLGVLCDNESFFDAILDRAISDHDILEKIVDKLVKEYYGVIETKIMEHEDVEEKRQQIQNEIEKLEEEQEKLRASNEEKLEQNKIEFEDQLKNLKSEVEDLEEYKNELSEEIGDLKEVQNLTTRKENLENEYRNLKAEYENQKVRNDEKRKDAEEIQNQLESAIQRFKHGTHAIEELIDKELLNRIYDIVNERSVKSKINEVKNIDVNSDFTAEEMIEALVEYINACENRKMSRNEVINLIICISQGFITTLAGEPGTGKTSLSTILGRALGLNSVNDNRLIEVSVERGWTSYKDYIGYYNPLTKSLEKSNVEVFDSMESASSECDGGEYPFLIYLLDEANLSQIEYYWSIFLRLCDTDSSRKRSITLGGDISWQIPAHMKFLATVNFDHTTEELSPRFLDRSWVIMLQPEEFEVVNSDESEGDKSIIPYSYNKVYEYFGSNRNVEINEACENKWNDLRKICKNNNYLIMPRSVKMVEDYMRVASEYMDMDSAETKLAPLDFAFSQKILPSLNGNIDSLVDALLQECENAKMPLCEGHLKRMKDDATHNMGYYQFFAHKIGG